MVILVVAVLLAAGLSIASSVMDFTLPEKVVQTVLAPLRTGVSHLKSQAEQFYSYMFRYEALQAENISLKEQISQMQDAARDAEELRRENDRLQREYEAGYDLDDILQQAQAMGLVPESEVQTVTVQLPPSQPEVVEPTFWEQVGAFFAWLFA